MKDCDKPRTIEISRADYEVLCEADRFLDAMDAWDDDEAHDHVKNRDRWSVLMLRVRRAFARRR